MKFVLMLALAAGVHLNAQKLAPVDDSGYPKLVAAQKGKVVLVNFWATWCKPCRAEMPALQALAEKLRPRGFELITISNDEADKQPQVLKALSEYKIAGVTYLRKTADDDKFCDTIDPKWQGVLPALFIYDRSGKKARAFFGETPMPTIEAAIQKLL
jgi:thiol-disulfide isomerase/thioredoxin